MNQMNNKKVIENFSKLLSENINDLIINDITDEISSMPISIDKICLTPDIKLCNVIQYYDNNVTGLYLSEWNKGVGKILFTDMKNLLKNKFNGKPYFRYFEIKTSTEKYLIRCISIDYSPKDEFDKLSKLGLIHGTFNEYVYTIIKCINVNQSYASKQVVLYDDVEGSYIDNVENNNDIEDDSEMAFECVKLFD